uniref:Uncharacterized protein n=1 Tax=Medicago truncatula TaxID=3880 RepID=I3SXD6_MEDTR|nr:unknown [Medicago truncatula]
MTNFAETNCNHKPLFQQRIKHCEITCYIVPDIQGRIKQHKLSSLAKAKVLRRPLRMF